MFDGCEGIVSILLGLRVKTIQEGVAGSCRVLADEHDRIVADRLNNSGFGHSCLLGSIAGEGGCAAQEVLRQACLHLGHMVLVVYR